MADEQKPAKPAEATPQKSWREMNSAELARYIDNTETAHKKHMTKLRAYLRALETEQVE